MKVPNAVECDFLIVTWRHVHPKFITLYVLGKIDTRNIIDTPIYAQGGRQKFNERKIKQENNGNWIIALFCAANAKAYVEWQCIRNCDLIVIHTRVRPMNRIISIWIYVSLSCLIGVLPWYSIIRMQMNKNCYCILLLSILSSTCSSTFNNMLLWNANRLVALFVLCNS